MAGRKPGLTNGRTQEAHLSSKSDTPSRLRDQGEGHASWQGTPQTQSYGRAPAGDVRQYVRGADQARADRHHAAEGEGTAPDRREASHARQARRTEPAPPGRRR